MRLKRVRVTNYRCVEDSEWFEVDRINCLVGKNESGKTAIMQGLATLNPDPSTPIRLERERDYPRRHLADYEMRHGDQPPAAVETEWVLDEPELRVIAAEFGPAALGGDASPLVSILRRYDAEQPEWHLPFNLSAALSHLAAQEGLSEAEAAPWVASTDQAGLAAAIEQHGKASPVQTRLAGRLRSYPSFSPLARAIALLTPYLPYFMYFSNYDRMASQVRLDDLRTRLDAGNALSVEEMLFLDFLTYAGLSLSEVEAASTYETFNAKLESASNRITEQVLEYWTQTPDLEVEVRVTKAEPRDKPPFNEGVIGRARVRNSVHRATVPFAERSAGFVWFFSFLVKFSQVQSDTAPPVILLDEPGLTLHGRAQADLIRFLESELGARHQILYSTHSPFMIAGGKHSALRVVEDKIVSSGRRRTSLGTKITGDLDSVDADTLYPLRGALVYQLINKLWQDRPTLLVDSPADVLLLSAWSAALGHRGGERLDPRWSVVPAGPLGRAQVQASIFGDEALGRVVVLGGFNREGSTAVAAAGPAGSVPNGRVLDYAALLNLDEADAEDVFSPALYAGLVNASHQLKAPWQLGAEVLGGPGRLLKRVETAFEFFPVGSPIFDRYLAAEQLLRDASVLEGSGHEAAATLARAQGVISAVNAMLPK